MKVSTLLRISGLGIALAVAAGCDGDEAQSTTETDSTPPQVVSMSPTDGATGIPTTTTVSATFSEAIDPSAVTTASFSVDGTAGTVSVSGATATFTPDAPLTPGTEYTATLTDAIADLAGNSLATPETWTFTTNVTPAADAGPDIAVALGEEVTLQGSASDSDQGQAFSFTWTQVSGPDVGALSGEDPTFTAPGEVSTIELDLTVSDGVDTSPADRVVVRVLEDPADALWVSAAEGDDGNPGTRAEPLATIQAAVDAADAAGTGADVYVAAGTYPESIALADMVSVYGGFSEGWVREIGAHETIVDGGTAAVTGSGAGGLTLDGLTIQSADATAPGESSVGVALDAGVELVLSRNVITAGSGAPGTDRPSVLSAADGGPGDPGSNSAGGSGGTGTCAGGNGGDGGETGGSTGGPGLCGGGAGGAGAPGQDSNGQPGDPGGPGAPGTHGTSGEAFGSMAGGTYTPADGSDGTDGDPGSGGGGGGGGGGQSATGRSGGGGGGGGGGGEGGGGALGGGGGGGSFGVLLSNGTTAVLEENTITTSDGGPGGDGGTGGAGGNGGGKGNGVITLLGDGREGGDGGDGGDGGSGGGGGGGPTIGIVEDGSSSSNVSAGDLGDNEVTLGAPGAGGLHGDPAEDDGAEGEAVPYKKN